MFSTRLWRQGVHSNGVPENVTFATLQVQLLAFGTGPEDAWPSSQVIVFAQAEVFGISQVGWLQAWSAWVHHAADNRRAEIWMGRFSDRTSCRWFCLGRERAIMQHRVGRVVQLPQGNWGNEQRMAERGDHDFGHPFPRSSQNGFEVFSLRTTNWRRI